MPLIEEVDVWGWVLDIIDRYLQQIAVEKRIGIAWDNQLSEEMLPMAPHDEWMHTIVTPSESIHCYKE